jgi:hypothetical protein
MQLRPPLPSHHESCTLPHDSDWLQAGFLNRTELTPLFAA